MQLKTELHHQNQWRMLLRDWSTGVYEQLGVNANVNHRKRSRGGRTTAIAVLIAAVGLVASACGSGGSSEAGGGDGLPAIINVASIRDMTGHTAFAGVPTYKGAQVAIDEINKTKYLGDSVLKMEKLDPASSPQTAASLTSQAVASREYSAILGPVLSAEAMTVGPIAQKGKLPVIFTQSGTEGILIGDYTFRATAPYPFYYDAVGEYLKSKGVKTIAVIYDTTVSSYIETTEKIIPQWESKFGIKIVATTAVQASTQDFTAPVSTILKSNPDVVAQFTLGTANGTVVQQLRQGGFDGTVIAVNGAGSGNLKGAGENGAGVVWPTSFSAAQADESAVKFIKLFQAMFPDETPTNYAAEGYDAVWWLARALKKVDSASPEQVQKGLVAVSKEGFTGAAGAITFEGNDMRIEKPVLVEWDGTTEALAK